MEAASLLQEAGRAAGRLERENAHWADPLAELVRAGIASVENRSEDAARSLSDAERAFEAVDMALYAAVARRRRGELIGGDEGQALVERADDWMRGEGIRNPSGMAMMLAPGRWSR